MLFTDIQAYQSLSTKNIDKNNVYEYTIYNINGIYNFFSFYLNSVHNVEM